MNLKLPIPESQLKAAQQSHKRATYFYYKEEFAVAAKNLLDKLHSSGNTIRVPLNGCSVATIRLQYYQGAKYLIDNLDKEKKYKTLYANTVCRAYEDYLELHVKRSFKTSLEAAVEIIPWREEFEHFLDEAQKDQKFYKAGLSLSDADLLWIESQLSTMTKEDGSPAFYGEIQKDHILLIKDL